MKILMRTTMAGPEWSAGPGQLIDIPEKIALELVTGGFAKSVDAPESANIEPPETAALPKPKGRRGKP